MADKHDGKYDFDLGDIADAIHQILQGKEEEQNSHGYYVSKDGSMDVIDVMNMFLSDDELRGFYKGNLLKYIFRAGRKPNEPASKDLGKAMEYLAYWEALELTNEGDDNVSPNE